MTDIGKNKRNLYFMLVAGAALLLSAWFFWPTSLRVEMAKVQRLPLTETVDAEGRTRVKRKYTVTAPVSGKLKRIELREGDTILRNYLITEVDPNPPIPRAPSSIANGALNPYAAKVYSPASGTVLRVLEKSERFLEAGTPLLELGDPTDIEIVADVLSSDAVRIHPGASVLIENFRSDSPVRARVTTIEPQAATKVSALGVEEKRVDIVADFIGPKPAFGDNYRIDVNIVLWHGDNVLCVPTGALFASDGEWYVFVVEKARASRRKVNVLHRSREVTQVTEGLSEGETVVIHPPNSLSEGAWVREE